MPGRKMGKPQGPRLGNKNLEFYFLIAGNIRVRGQALSRALQKGRDDFLLIDPLKIKRIEWNTQMPGDLPGGTLVINPRTALTQILGPIFHENPRHPKTA